LEMNRRALITIALAGCACIVHAQDRGFIQIPESRKLALVIGNSEYPKAPLKNPVNDAAAMETTLKSLGFDVTTVRNADLRRMRTVIDEFAAKLGPGSLGFFYFAGHGVQVNSVNYLLPVDFSATSEDDIPYEAYPASRVQAKLEGSGARLRVLVLDACRNNPFRFKRDSSEGLASMSISAEGTLIAFATGDNNTAAENPAETNGLYTKFLVPALLSPGLNLRDAFQKAKEDVYRVSRRQQNPSIYENIVGQYALLPADAPRPMAPTVDPPRSGVVVGALGPTASAADVEAWNGVRDSTSPQLFDQFLKEYPNSQYAGAARLRLAALLGPAGEPATFGGPPGTGAPVSANESPVSLSADEPGRPTLRRTTTSEGSAGESRPTIKNKVEPDYPASARNTGIQGSVEVSLLVGVDGIPRNVRVTRGLDPALDQSAIEAVEAWQFTPGTRDGQPVATKATVNVEFRLPGGRAAPLRVGKMEISKFAGLVPGDTKEKATSLFGKACKTEPSLLLFTAGCSTGSKMFGPEKFPEIGVRLAADGERIVAVTVSTWGKGRAEKGGNDVLLDLLRKKEADVIAALGDPTKKTKNSWQWKASNASASVECEVYHDRCTAITIYWYANGL
jgi:TonB family protein